MPSTLVNVQFVTDVNHNELVGVDDRRYGGVQAVDRGERAEMAVVGQVPARPRDTIIITDAVAETYNGDTTFSDVV